MKKIQLSISNPCQEKWEDMAPDKKARPDDPFGRGKFCDSCQKKVIDFSMMTDREIAQFFKRPSIGTVCGRFMDDQLNRDIEIPRKKIPWVKYFFQFTLPAFLISMKASSQKAKPLMGKVAAVCIRPVMGDTITQSMKNVVEELVIKGITTDTSGNPIPYSSISIKGTNIGVQSNIDGKFIFHLKQGMNQISIVASAVGYESKEISINANTYSGDSLNLMLPLSNAMMGEVVITSAGVKRMGKVGLVGAVSTITTYDQVKNWFIPVKQNFKTFPNPANAGANVNIEWKQFETGYFLLQFFNLAGQLLVDKEILVEGKHALINFELPQVAAGNYVLRMTSKQTAKAFSEKIIIQ